MRTGRDIYGTDELVSFRGYISVGVSARVAIVNRKCGSGQRWPIRRLTSLYSFVFGSAL